jgi:hypothetical protein
VLLSFDSTAALSDIAAQGISGRLLRVVLSFDCAAAL